MYETVERETYMTSFSVLCPLITFIKKHQICVKYIYRRDSPVKLQAAAYDYSSLVVSCIIPHLVKLQGERHCPE